jgi:predicted PurR-regulated permease PerM
MNFPGPTDQQARTIWFAVTALAVALTLVIVATVLWGVGYVIRVLSPVLWPLAVAGVFAYLLDPVVEFLVKQRFQRLRAIVAVFVFALLLVAGVFGSIIPRVVVEARDLAGKIPTYVTRLEAKVEDWINNPPAPLIKLLPPAVLERLHLAPAATTNRPVPPQTTWSEPTPGRETNAPTGGNLLSVLPPPAEDSPWWVKALDPRALKSAGGWLAAVLPGIGSWLAGQLGKVASWFGILAGLALIPVYTFYFLMEKHGIEQHWTNYLPISNSKWKDELVFILSNINDALVVFFRGQVLVAICDGVLYTIGFLLIGLPYALLLGLMATVLTMIPFLGAITTCSLALVIALVQFGDWLHPGLVLVVFAVVQTLEGFVIQPKIIGDRVGLHPMTIIVALMVGTTLLGGILGGILAIPLTAALRALMFRYVWRRP